MKIIKKEETEKTKKIFVNILIFVAVLYLIFAITLFFTEKTSLSAMADFGSSISGLFAGAAAYLVFLTLRVQKQELEATRSELKLSREQQSRKALEESFYNQLSLLSQNRNALRLKNGNIDFQGQEVIDNAVIEAINLYRQHINKHMDLSFSGEDKNDKIEFYHAFEKLDFESQQDLIRDLRKHLKRYGGDIAGPLFFLIKIIVEFIEENRTEFQDKSDWMERLLKSQLLINEVLFIYWQSIIGQPPILPQHSFLLKPLKPIPEFFFFDIEKMKEIPKNYVEAHTLIEVTK